MMRTVKVFALGALMAAGTYMAIAQVIVFFAFQRYFVQGITVGGIKG